MPTKYPVFFFVLFFFLTGILLIVYQYTHPPKKIILDRLNGIITFPGVFYGKPITMPFDKVSAALKFNGIGAGVSLGFSHHKILATDIVFRLYTYKNLGLSLYGIWIKTALCLLEKLLIRIVKKDFQRRKSRGGSLLLYIQVT